MQAIAIIGIISALGMVAALVCAAMIIQDLRTELKHLQSEVQRWKYRYYGRDGLYGGESDADPSQSFYFH